MVMNFDECRVSIEIEEEIRRICDSYENIGLVYRYMDEEEIEE